MNDILPKSYVESSRKLQQMVGKFPGIVSTFPECKPLNGHSKLEWKFPHCISHKDEKYY